VITYPEPNNTLGSLNAKCAKIQSKSNGPVFPDFFKMKGRMMDIHFEKLEIFAHQDLDRFRKGLITTPKAG